MTQTLPIRLAVASDAPALGTLIEVSVRGLQANDYSPSQIEGALGNYLGLDTQLIADRTYFVVESGAPPQAMSPHIVACGGWGRRKTLCGSDHRAGRDNTLLDPATDAAKIRAFFVHPEWARKGIGSLLLERCEAAARAEGFTRFEMGATLTGVPLYRARGYIEIERMELPLAGGQALPIVRMAKDDTGVAPRQTSAASSRS